MRSLLNDLGVRDLDELRRALAEGRVARLRGFGPVIRAKLARALAGDGQPDVAGAASPPGRRLPLALAAQYAEPLVSYLRALPEVRRVEVAGSFRRGRDQVGDLDVLVCASRGAAVIAALKRYEDVERITSAGSTRASAVLHAGLAVDLRVVSAASFGAAWHYLTGCKEHNIRLRRRALERGLKLSEYGLFRGARRIAGASEEEVYGALGLPWIPPELREDRGEIEAAESRTLPRLVEVTDLRGDLHVHTDASDGADSLPRMVEAARARGLHYVAITDHSRHVGVTHGLDAGRLSRQIDAIDRLNDASPGIAVLKGAEVDILEDGRLALPDAVLARLDLVLIAVHTQLDLPLRRQTDRILRALERPHVSVLAHPFGRLLGERAESQLDFERVLDAVHERGCFLEINSQPARLDLDDVHARAARDRGVLLSIASDAHAAGQFDLLPWGVRQARRGWLEARHVLNAKPLSALRRLLKS